MPTKMKTNSKSPPRKTAVALKPLSTKDGPKKDVVLRMLRRQNGASIAELAEATEWQNHSVRGFLAATVRKKLELPLASTKEADADRRYHIAAVKSAKE